MEETTDFVSIPLNIETVSGELIAVELELNHTAGLEFQEFRNIPENWLTSERAENGALRISLISTEAFKGNMLGEVVFKITDPRQNQSIGGHIVLNENEVQALESLNITERPTEFSLSQNYPNPFNPVTNIVYTVPDQAQVRILVFDVLGQQVAELVNNEQSPGRYTVSWDASQHSSGLYMYRLVAGDKVITKKMMLIK